jgi:hypothetical protein
MQDGNHQRGIVSRQTPQPATPAGIVTTHRRASDLTAADLSEKLTGSAMTAREVVAQARVFLKAFWFDPKFSDDEMTVYESHFVKALEHIPAWAAREAFTNISADPAQKYLPRPGVVKAEAIRVMAPLRAEAKDRARAALPAPPKEGPEDRAASSERMAYVIGRLRAAAGESKF